MISWRNWIAWPPRTQPTLPADGERESTTERGWPLRITLLLAVTVALLPIAVVSILQGIERARVDFAEVHDRLESSARSAAAEEDNLLLSAEQITRALSHLSDVRAISPRCNLILSDVLIGVRFFSNIARIDPSGTTRCSALPRGAGMKVVDRAAFERARVSKAFAVSGLFTSPLLHRPVIAGILPLYEGDSFQGAIGISLELHWLDFMVRAKNLQKGAIVFIYDAKGNLLASNNPHVAQALLKSTVIGTHSGIQYARDGKGDGWTFGTAPLRSGALTVAFAQRESSLFGGTYLRVGADFLMPILMIGLAWAGIWFATERQVTQWIAYLRRISAAYRSGHYTVRPQLEGAPREFRSLGTGLSEMAASIQDRDRKLRDALAQKSLLIREIHHRVKNNLQIVMSLLSLQAGQLRDPAANEALMQAQIRINALALVHRILHEIEDQTTIDLKRLLHELTHQIVEGMRGGSNIEVIEDLVERDVSGDVAVPLALFAVEALTNIFKYAFPAGSSGQIHISLAPAKTGFLKLEIKDNGNGFDPSVGRTGIGTRLIRTFGQQIGGKSILQSAPGQGTRIEVEFPDPAMRDAA